MKTPNAKLLDESWFRNEYEVNQKSLRSIAIELGVTTAVVSKYAKRYGFVLRTAGESKSLTAKIKGPKSRNPTAQIDLSNKEWLYQKYVTELLSMRDIVELIGLKNRRTVKRALIMHNIPIRDLKKARQMRTIKGPEFRKTVPALLNDIDYLKDEYVNNSKSLEEIKRDIGCSAKAIQRRLQNAGISLRTCNEANIGRKHSPETLQKMSITATNQIINGARSSYCHGKRVNCLSPLDGFVTMRSTWEKKYAEYLKLNNIHFRYENKSFLLSNGKSYVADFYLIDSDEYVEIKGYLSQDQSDKYTLFRQEYSDIKWKILYKENLLDLGIDLKIEIPTVYLLIGAPAAGKSWVASHLLDKFDYVSYDANPKKEHINLLKTPSNKPKLYDPTFKISTIIRRHSDEFNFVLVSIYEEEQTLRDRIAIRGGKWTETILKRNEVAKKRYQKYGANGFIGTSEEVLIFLRNANETIK
jgi:hypothetical protein